MTMGEPTTEFETVLLLCQHRFRRIVLTVLTDHRQTVSVTDLTECIVQSTQQPTTGLDSEEAVSIHTALHHLHLPALAEAGVVEYDVDRKLVTPTPTLSQLQPQLTAIIELESVFNGAGSD